MSHLEWRVRVECWEVPDDQDYTKAKIHHHTWVMPPSLFERSHDKGREILIIQHYAMRCYEKVKELLQQKIKKGSQNCFVCGEGPVDGITLYRENEPGEMPAIWACREHRTKPSPVQDIVDIIEKGEQE